MAPVFVGSLGGYDSYASCCGSIKGYLMEENFSTQVMSLLNSVINPLMASMVSIDQLVQEEAQKPERFSKLLLVDQQIQRSIEYFLELRTLVMLNHEHELCFLNKPKLKKDKELGKGIIINI